MNELQRLSWWLKGVSFGLFVGGIASLFLASYWMIVMAVVIIVFVFFAIDIREPKPRDILDIDTDISTITLSDIPDGWETGDKRKML